MQDIKLLSDEDLVEQVRSNDKELFREIIQRYQNKLLRYARFLLNHRDETVDVVQEAFIKAFVNLNSFDTGKKFSSWIYRIVHNECMNQIKRRRNHVSLEENDWVSDMEDKKEDVIEKFTKKETGEILKGAWKGCL
ncbi:sigma-70 family RNA polymerase sigma factor [Candidatus Daviesbacteria bacterium]|nr:sigma-70 family RNA polymerase sigma factor [Candidatus Daviesbacteria bacterium]